MMFKRTYFGILHDFRALPIDASVDKFSMSSGYKKVLARALGLYPRRTLCASLH